MWKIGSLTIKNQIVSAPMAGVSDKAYRQLAAEMGCGLLFSEMISDMGLCYDQKRTWELAEIRDEGVPLVLQIFGSTPASMAAGAKKLEQHGAAMIDINMGCPTSKVVKNGSGSALMRELQRARALIAAVRDAIDIPLSIKMRSGWENGEESCLELALIAQEEGADAITLHPRSRMQFFSDHSDWELIAATKKLINIPLIGNGDIMSAADALKMVEQTGCDAVMIGRGALGNPFLFTQAAALLGTGCEVPGPTAKQRLAMARYHLELMIAHKGEAVAVREMRKHISWYFKGMPAAARMREAVNRALTHQEMLELLQQMDEIQQRATPA